MIMTHTLLVTPHLVCYLSLSIFLTDPLLFIMTSSLSKLWLTMTVHNTHVNTLLLQGLLQIKMIYILQHISTKWQTYFNCSRFFFFKFVVFNIIQLNGTLKWISVMVVAIVTDKQWSWQYQWRSIFPGNRSFLLQIFFN